MNQKDASLLLPITSLFADRLSEFFHHVLIDYCSTALAGLPQATVAPLQCVQNSAAPLIFELSSCGHITPCLPQLHWLPVRWHIQFKLCCIMHSVFYGTCPAYLTNIVESAGASRTHSGLCSTSTTDFMLPQLCTKFN